MVCLVCCAAAQVNAQLTVLMWKVESKLKVPRNTLLRLLLWCPPSFWTLSCC